MNWQVLLFIVVGFNVLHCVAERQTIVISDLHVGSIWFKEASIAKLNDFLDILSKNNSIILQQGDAPLTEIVINGDLFEFWLDPIYVNPKKPSEVLQSVVYGTDIPALMKKLKVISDMHTAKIILTKGNHDLDLSQTDVDMLKANIGLNLTFTTIHRDSGVRYEHGHFQDFFNKPHPDGLRPYGYYAARAVATAGKTPTIEFLESLCIAFPTISGIISTQKLLDSAFGESSIDPSTIFKGGCVYSSCSGCDFSKAQVKTKYSQYWTRMQMSQYSADEINYMVQAGCGSYDNVLSHNIDSSLDKIVILGHTHRALHKELTSKKKGTKFLYVNSGTWVDEKLTYDFVKIYFKNLSETEEYAYKVERYRFGNPPTLVASIDSSKYYTQTTQVSRSVQKIEKLAPPASWTCNYDWYDDGNCYCGCGTYDPDCEAVSLSDFKNCKSLTNRFLTGCNNVTGQCEYQYSKAPPEWTCDASFWNAGDGCDCNCGPILDPDCRGSKECNCVVTDILSEASVTISTVYTLVFLIVLIVVTF